MTIPANLLQIPETPSIQTSPNNPAGLPTEADILRQHLAQQGAQITELTNVMRGFIQNQSAPPPTPAPTFNYDPDRPAELPGIIQQMIRHELNQSVAPLNDFRRTFERTNAYAAIKHQVKAGFPHLAKIWHILEPQLDATFSTGNIEVNPQIVAYHAQALFGTAIAQNPALLNAPVNAPPAMIPPSGAPTPSTQIPSAIPLRALTPNEETLRAARGWTVEQYLQASEGNVMLLTPKAGK